MSLNPYKTHYYSCPDCPHWDTKGESCPKCGAVMYEISKRDLKDELEPEPSWDIDESPWGDR